MASQPSKQPGSPAPCAFVTGWPIRHSLSPHLHGYWLRHHGIDGSYRAIAIPPPEFDSFLRSLPSSGFAGGNVTIPHKEAAGTICDELTADAKAIGAVNTVWLDQGRIWGGNTDAYGFLANLDENAPGWDRAGIALVIGAGGAARAVLHGLRERRISRILLANRTRARAEQLARVDMSAIEIVEWNRLDGAVSSTDLIVNTTSLGLAGNPSLSLSLEPAPRSAIVHDLVYNPLETPLLRDAGSLGLRTVDGLGMLLHQAVPGFERWFGKRPAVDAGLRAHLVSILQAPGGRS